MTYSDMMTLLLVFFVVLYMLTPGVDLHDLQQMLRRFQGGHGLLEQQKTVVDRKTVVPDKSATLPDQSATVDHLERWQALIDLIEDRQLEEFLEVELITEGIRITLSESVTFNSGSSELLPQARNILSEIADLFTDDIYQTEVQGHTDNVPLRPGAYYRSNWDLGAARAVSVVRFIKSVSELPAERFKASSYSEYHPVQTNQTESGRRANRRVEIYIRYQDANSNMQGNRESGYRPVALYLELPK